jgi:hypothetical protein
MPKIVRVKADLVPFGGVLDAHVLGAVHGSREALFAAEPAQPVEQQELVRLGLREHRVAEQIAIGEDQRAHLVLVRGLVFRVLLVVRLGRPLGAARHGRGDVVRRPFLGLVRLEVAVEIGEHIGQRLQDEVDAGRASLRFVERGRARHEHRRAASLAAERRDGGVGREAIRDEHGVIGGVSSARQEVLVAREQRARDRELGDRGEVGEVHLGLGIEQQEQLAAALRVAFEGRGFFGEKRLPRRGHDHQPRVGGHVVGETLGEPQILQRVVLRLGDLAQPLRRAAFLFVFGLRVVELAVTHREVGRAARAEALQEGLLEVRVEGLELRLGALHLDAEGQLLIPLAALHDDHAVLHHLRFFREGGDEQPIVEIDLHVRRVLGDLVEVAAHLQPDVVQLGEKRHHGDRLRRARRDALRRLAGLGGAEEREIGLHLELARGVNEQARVGGREGDGNARDRRGADPSALDQRRGAHGREGQLGEHDGQRGRHREHHVADRRDGRKTRARVGVGGGDAEQLFAERRGAAVDEQRRDAAEREQRERALHRLALERVGGRRVAAREPDEAQRGDHDHGEGAEAGRGRAGRVDGGQHTLAEVHEHEPHDVRGREPSSDDGASRGGGRLHFHRRASKVFVAAKRKK